MVLKCLHWRKKENTSWIFKWHDQEVGQLISVPPTSVSAGCSLTSFLLRSVLLTSKRIRHHRGRKAQSSEANRDFYSHHMFSCCKLQFFLALVPTLEAPLHSWHICNTIFLLFHCLLILSYQTLSSLNTDLIFYLPACAYRYLCAYTRQVFGTSLWNRIESFLKTSIIWIAVISFYSTKRFSILIFRAGFIPLIIQHVISSGQKMWMNTAA